MKKALSLLLTFVMIMGVVFSFPVTAYAEEGDGTGEEIVIPDGSEEGDGSDEGTGGSNVPEGIFETDDGCWQYSYISEDELAIVEYISSDLVAEVPETIDGKKVVELYSQVFMYTSFVTKLIIPKTVKRIDYGIFWGGSDIAEFEIHPDNPVYEVRANAIVVKETDTLLIGSCNTQLDESHGIKEIGHGAFNYNSHITSFYIPNTVEKIDKGAFMGCSSLESIEIPASVKSIGEDAFYQCNLLTEMIVADENAVYDSRENCNAIIETETNTLLFGCGATVIPESVTAIENGAFYEQYDYTNGYFHEGLVSIGEDAFFDCGISEVYIPDSVESIGVGAFSGCDYIYSIQVAEENPVYDSRNNCNAIIETETNTIISGCKKTVIPDGSDDTEAVVAIGNSAFEGAMQMYKLTVPNSVILIDDEAFFNCNNLRRLTIVNPECAIIDNEDIAGYDVPPGDYDYSYCCTISNSTEYVKDGIVICAKPESKAYEYSVRYGCPFQDIDNLDAITFYFVDSANWGQLNVQVFDDQFNSVDDPDIIISERIHEDVVNDEGDVRPFDYFEVTLDIYYDYIQFSDGVADSENITEPEEIAADWYYNQADGEWYKSLLDIPYDSGNDDEDDGEDDWENDYSGAYLVIDYADENKDDHILFDINDEDIWERDFAISYNYDYEDNFYTLKYQLSAGDKIKVAYYDNTDVTYYKGEAEDWYTVSEEEAGWCIITFDEYGRLTSDYEYILVEPYTIPEGYYLMGTFDGIEYNYIDVFSEENRLFLDYGNGEYALYSWGELYEDDKILVAYYNGSELEYVFEEPYVITGIDVGGQIIHFAPDKRFHNNTSYIFINPPEAGYYLLTDEENSINGNSYDRLFQKNGMGEYILNYWLYDGDQIKVAYFDGEKIAKYYVENECYNVNLDVDELYANIFFDPNGGYDPDVYYGYLKIEEYSEAPFNKGYYILGTVDGYEYTEDGLHNYDYLRFELNDKGEFVLNIDFYNTDNVEFRVVYFDGNEITETYVEDEPYVVPKWVLGDADVYFDPDGGYEEYYGHLKFREHRGFCEYEEENHLYNDGKEHDSCVYCGKIKDELLAERVGNYMVLTDKIEMFYNIRFVDEVMDDKEAKVIFNLPNGEVLEYLVTDGKRDGLQTYQYSCEVAAKEMADLIEVTVVSGDKTTKLSDYSVRKYAEDLYYWNQISMEGDGNGTHEKQIELIKALLNYGAAAQYYFNYHTDDLANTPKYYDEATGETYEWMTTEDKVLADVSLSEFESSVTGSEEGIEYYGSALSLESGTAIKHYFLIEEGTDIPDANVYYADGTPIGTYELTKNIDLYQLKFEDIYGQELDEMYIVEVGGITINYGAFSYGAKAMEQEGAKFDTMKNVVKALRAYNLAADTYLEVVQ